MATRKKTLLSERSRRIAERRRRRRAYYRAVARKEDRQQKEKMQRQATRLLRCASDLLCKTAALDTACRDRIADGLARLVYVAYDCEALARNVATEEFISYIEHKTYAWFRQRGFAEWFCRGAACQFNSMVGSPLFKEDRS